MAQQIKKRGLSDTPISEIFHKACEEKDLEKVKACLEFAPPERLVFAPDCGLSQTARWAARKKLCNMVEGVRRVKETLG